MHVEKAILRRRGKRDAGLETGRESAVSVRATVTPLPAPPSEVEIVRTAHDHDRPDAFVMTYREVADLLRAEIVPDYDSPCFPELIHHAQHVVHDVVGVIERRVDRTIAV